MTTDQSQPFWSAGYDADGNFHGNEATTNWSSSGDLGLSGTGASILFEPSTPVSGTLTADVGGTIYETGTITVSEGDIDHIIVRDAPDGLGNEVADHTMTTDESLTLYAAGYDGSNNFIENTLVNWTLTGTLDGIPISDTVFVFDPVEAPRSGTINAQIGTKQDATGTITVTYGAFASLLIRDAAEGGGNVVTTLTMSAGDNRTFYAAGYDGDGNFRLDEPTAVWTSTFGLGGSGSSFLFSPTVPEVGTITATVSGIPYTTGDITVNPSTLGYLIIRDGPDGTGNDLTDTAIALTADSSLTLYAAGYDASDNYIGDQVVDWFSTGDLDYININASSFSFNPVSAPASGTIGITNGTFGNTTDTITVSVGALSYITINDIDGAAVNTLTLTAGVPVQFFAVGYDSDGNSISEVVADWSRTGNLDDVSGTATNIIFIPITAPSTGTIVATAGLFSDATGLITVEEGELDHIDIRTAAGGSGVVYGDTSLTADGSLTMYAAAYDDNNNYLFDVSVSWSSTGSLDNITANSSSYTFNPVFAPGSGTIVATSGIYSGQTGTINVALGTFDHITINSSFGAGGVPVGDLIMTADDTYTFYAASYDADNNFLDTVGATWDKTGGLDDVSGTGASYTFAPVTAPRFGSITATFSGETDATGTITVNTGDLDYILITDVDGIEIEDVLRNVGVDLVLQSRGYDQDGNERGRESAIWRTTGGLDDVIDYGETFVFTPSTAPATGTITATSELNPAKSDTTGIITVEEGVLTWIQIRTAPDGDGEEFGSHSMTADEPVWLYAAGYDAGDNFINNISVIWSTTGSLETINVTDTSLQFTPTLAPATGTIRITSGSLIDDTGIITVSPGAPVSMTDTDDLSGERTTVAGSTQLIKVTVEDQHGNGVAGVTVNFSPAGDMSVPSDITDSDGLAESVYNTPRDVDSSLVQASASGLSPVNFTVYAINYVSGSLDPVVVQRGGSPTFTLQVANPGNTTFPLSTGSSNFSFNNGSYSYSATLASPSSLAPNSSAITLTFTPTLIDENFPGGAYTGEIQLVGSGIFTGVNGVIQTDLGELTIGSGDITIGTVEIDDPVLQGDQDIIATVHILNDGQTLEIDPFTDTRIEFKRNDNGQIQPVDNLERTDGNLFLVGGGVITELEFRFDLPAEYQTGLIDVFVRLSLDEGNLVIQPEEPSGSFNVLLAGNANYVDGSLIPDEVIPREVVYFSASFENTGSANIVLSRSESTIEINGSGLGTRSLVSQFILDGNSTTEIFFEPLTIPVGLSTGDYNVSWELNGTLINGSEYESSGVITGGLTVVSAANLSFSNITVVPDRVKQGQAGIDVIYRINNLGESTASITSLDHQFNFTVGGEVPVNQWIPTEVSPQLPFQIIPGGNRPVTVTYLLSTSATTGMVYPNPTVSYFDTRTPTIPYTSNTIVQNDQVEVVEPASVKIAQLEALAPNSPYVNREQQFNLSLTVENTGADQIQTAWVSIYRDQEEESFRDQIVISNIAPAGQKSFSFQHSESVIGTYLYRAEIDSAIDAIGDPVTRDPPDDRDEFVYVQEPSRLEIDASILSNLMKYDSLTVSEDQEFLVQAKITNFGESAFSEEGNGRFVLRLPDSTFSFVSDLSDSIRTFTSQDTMVEWAIQATGVSPGGLYEELTFSLIDIPVDKNTGQDVADISVLDNAVHIISEEKGTIDVNQLSILSPEGAIDGILSTKQEFTVRAQIDFNHAIASEGRTAELALPFGYSLKAGQQLIIDSLGTSPAEWTIIALDRDRTDDEIFVTASGYDQNSGLLVTKISNAIPLSVVERTDLVLTLQIIKAGGSPGDTLSEGQKFTLQAVIDNDGTARAIGVGKVYLEGIEENPSIVYLAGQEDTLSYAIGEPVGWELEFVNLPEGTSGLQSEIFQLMDDLENEKARVTAKGKNEITKSSRVRELYLQISDMVAALVTLEMNLTVKMSQYPEDENTNQRAFTRDSVVTKTIYLQPIARISIQSIVWPEKVSTYQEFNLTVTGILENNLIDPIAHLIIPESFESANGNEPWMEIPLESGSNMAEFTINVPSTVNFYGAQIESLGVQLLGNDSNTGLPIMPTPIQWKDVRVEMKPEIYMAKEIISPIAARETGSLSHGQKFIIDVWSDLIPSEKDLDYAELDGDGRIKLNDEIFTQYHFERIEDEEYDQTFTQLGQKLRFIVRAPREDQTALFDFRFVDLPRDKNSQDPVIVNSDSGSVSLPISVVEKKVTVIMDNDYEKTNFTRGEGQHLMMAFEISNAGFLDPLTVNGLGIKFIARSDTASLLDNAVIDIFDKILILDYEEYAAGSEKISNITSYVEFEVTETNVRNPLQIDFDEVGLLNGNESMKLAVVAMFRSGESSRSFRAILNNVDAYDDSPEHLVSIIDGEGRAIENSPDMMTQVLSILSEDQEKTFGNFPNPFGRSPNQTTEIRFLINSPSDVTLRLFSLAGELVKSAWNTNLTNLQPDVYYLVWDGKNDEGDTVLNGVYICVIEIRSSEGSKTFTTKIAYIK